MDKREYLESPLFRHGEIENLSKIIEKGEKPPYEDFIKFMEGKIDPPIDREATEKLIREKIKEGKKRDNFDIIIYSPVLRAKQTAELIKEILELEIPIHPSKYLREINIPMDDITPEFYEQAKDIYEVRKKFLDHFLSGKKIDEDIVDVYKRAERFLTYFRRIKIFTNKRPLFITHGLFPRFLELATNHQGEKLSDDEIRTIIKEEFSKTKRPGVLEGFRITSTKEGSKLLDLI